MKKIGAVLYLVVAVLIYLIGIMKINYIDGQLQDQTYCYAVMLLAIPVGLLTMLAGARAWSLAFPRQFWGHNCTGFKNMEYRHGMYQPSDADALNHRSTR